MERLTEKYKKYYRVKGYGSYEKTFNVFNKLGKLEDIEEKLGIDISTLFEALQNGVWCKECGFPVEHFDVRGIENDGLALISNICSYCDCDFTVYYKEYGKTWAMTKEELGE